MSGGEDDAKAVGGEHHRYVGSRQCRQHLGMAGIVVASGMERGFVDWRGNDSLHCSSRRELHGTLDRQPAQFSRVGRVVARGPVSHRFRYREPANFRTDHHDVTTLADPGVGERFSDDLWANSAGVSHGHGETNLHAATT
jgi:hypothetical protein